MLRSCTLLFTLFTVPFLTGQQAIPPPRTTTPASPPTAEDSGSLPGAIPHTEDWSAIQLSRSNLPAESIGGVLLSKIEMPGCTRELLRMQWRPNDPIDLYVIQPNGPKPLPVVVFIYNYTYDTDIFRADRWCERAKENGFAIAGFASALSWPRLHTPRPMKQWFVSELQEALVTSAHDVQMTINYLKSRGDLETDHVGIFGQGSGGAVAILAAAADERIFALDLMDPWGDWPAWLAGSRQIPDEERPGYLTPKFLGQVSGLDPVDFLPRLHGRALRIQQVLDDPVTPAAARDRIAAVASQAGQVTRFADQAAEGKTLGSNGILGWLGEQLGAQPASVKEGAPSAAKK